LSTILPISTKLTITSSPTSFTEHKNRPQHLTLEI